MRKKTSNRTSGKNFTPSTPEIRIETDASGNKSRCTFFDGRLASRVSFQPIIKHGIKCGYQGYVRKGYHFYTFLITPVFVRDTNKNIWRQLESGTADTSIKNNILMLSVSRKNGATDMRPAYNVKVVDKNSLEDNTYLAYAVDDKETSFFVAKRGMSILPEKNIVIFNQKK